MKSIVLAVAFALASSQVFAMDSLSELKWKNRVVIIFGASTDREAEQQTAAIKGRPSSRIVTWSFFACWVTRYVRCTENRNK